MARKPGRKGRPGKRNVIYGGVEVRVSLILTPQEVEHLDALARKAMRLTPRGRPRRGVIATELVRWALEHI